MTATEKYMLPIEVYEQVEKEVFYPIPAPKNFHATIRMYASSMARRTIYNTVKLILKEIDGCLLSDEEILEAINWDTNELSEVTVVRPIHREIAQAQLKAVKDKMGGVLSNAKKS